MLWSWSSLGWYITLVLYIYSMPAKLTKQVSCVYGLSFLSSWSTNKPFVCLFFFVFFNGVLCILCRSTIGSWSSGTGTCTHHLFFTSLCSFFCLSIYFTVVALLVLYVTVVISIRCCWSGRGTSIHWSLTHNDTQPSHISTACYQRCHRDKVTDTLHVMIAQSRTMLRQIRWLVNFGKSSAQTNGVLLLWLFKSAHEVVPQDSWPYLHRIFPVNNIQQLEVHCSILYNVTRLSYVMIRTCNFILILWHLSTY